MVEVIVAHLNYTIDEAWQLTPREMFTAVEAIRIKRREAYEQILWAEICTRRKHLPTIEEMTGEGKASLRIPTREEFDRSRAEFRAEMEAKYPGRFTWPPTAVSSSD